MNHLEKLSTADTFQVRSVAHERLVRRLGHLSAAEIQEIVEALAVVLHFRPQRGNAVRMKMHLQQRAGVEGIRALLDVHSFVEAGSTKMIKK